MRWYFCIIIRMRVCGSKGHANSRQRKVVVKYQVKA